MKSGLLSGVPRTFMPSASGHCRSPLGSDGFERKLPSGMSWIGRTAVGSLGVLARKLHHSSRAKG
jgi:hypothetical protein